MPTKRSGGSRAAKFAGLAVAAVGVAHFTSPSFSRHHQAGVSTRHSQASLHNGGIETAIGLGLSSRKTRPLAIVGLIGYGAYLAGNAVRNR